MKKTLLAITCASLLSPVSYLQAQEISVDETIVVTANRFEQAQSNTLADVEVVTRQDIGVLLQRNQTFCKISFLRVCLQINQTLKVILQRYHDFGLFTK